MQTKQLSTIFQKFPGYVWVRYI